MAAPSGIVWGTIVGSYGRIGIYTSVSNSNTATSVTIEIWFGSKYSVSDTSNTLYFDNLSYSGSASTSKGAVTVKTTVASGSGWSTSNEVKLASYTASYTRTISSQTRYLYAKLANIDRVGGTMYASTTFSVPQLASYTVSYNANGGSGAPSNQTKWYGTNITLSSTKPTRTGYSFAGWATSSSGSVAYAAGATYSSNASVTLYAKWTANTYTVSYNANGGSGAPSSQTKTYGVTLTLSSTKPTRSGYTFKGWGTSSGATTVSYAAGGSYTNNSAITLYAIWTLAYTKPKISSLSLTRCNSSGTANTNGTYALVKFSWSTYQTASKYTIVINSVTTSITLSGTSGSVSKVVGAGALTIEKSYVAKITVTDSGGSTTVQRTLSSLSLPIDFLKGGTGVAFGKSAETTKRVDSAWPFYSQYTDIGFIHTHPNTGYRVGVGVGAGGVNRGIYDYTRDKWMLYHDDTRLYYTTPSGGMKVFYYMAGDSVSLNYLYTAGFVTNSGTYVYFYIPLGKEVLSGVTATASTINGFQLRQDGNYTHGSTASTWAKPASYVAQMDTSMAGICCLARFTTTTNVVNNAPIGVRASIKITFA